MSINFKYEGYNLGIKPSLHLKKLLPFLQKKKIKTILDFGCGNGRNSFFLKKKGFDVFTIDSKQVISDVETDFNKFNISSKSYNINSTKIPYKNNSFDAIIAWRVLHRGLKEYRNKLIKELNRILKNKGYLIVAVSIEEDIKLDSVRRNHKEVEKNTFEYLSKGVKNKRHYYSEEEILSGEAFPNFKIISIEKFKEKTGHKDKSHFRNYWKVILQKN
jgi:SAM-dependent methyltransferase